MAGSAIPALPYAQPWPVVRAMSRHVAPDCSGLNVFALDRSLRDLLPLYMDAPLLAHLAPHLERLGELPAGG